jgi:hypothetical protein
MQPPKKTSVNNITLIWHTIKNRNELANWNEPALIKWENLLVHFANVDPEAFINKNKVINTTSKYKI